MFYVRRGLPIQELACLGRWKSSVVLQYAGNQGARMEKPSQTQSSEGRMVIAHQFLDHRLWMALCQPVVPVLHSVLCTGGQVEVHEVSEPSSCAASSNCAARQRGSKCASTKFKMKDGFKTRTSKRCQIHQRKRRIMKNPLYMEGVWV